MSYLSSRLLRASSAVVLSCYVSGTGFASNNELTEPNPQDSNTPTALTTPAAPLSPPEPLSMQDSTPEIGVPTASGGGIWTWFGWGAGSEENEDPNEGTELQELSAQNDVSEPEETPEEEEIPSALEAPIVSEDESRGENNSPVLETPALEEEEEVSSEAEQAPAQSQSWYDYFFGSSNPDPDVKKKSLNTEEPLENQATVELEDEGSSKAQEPSSSSGLDVEQIVEEAVEAVSKEVKPLQITAAERAQLLRNLRAKLPAPPTPPSSSEEEDEDVPFFNEEGTLFPSDNEEKEDQDFEAYRIRGSEVTEITLAECCDDLPFYSDMEEETDTNDEKPTYRPLVTDDEDWPFSDEGQRTSDEEYGTNYQGWPFSDEDQKTGDSEWDTSSDEMDWYCDGQDFFTYSDDDPNLRGSGGSYAGSYADKMHQEQEDLNQELSGIKLPEGISRSIFEDAEAFFAEAEACLNAEEARLKGEAEDVPLSEKQQNLLEVFQGVDITASLFGDIQEIVAHKKQQQKSGQQNTTAQLPPRDDFEHCFGSITLGGEPLEIYGERTYILESLGSTKAYPGEALWKRKGSAFCALASCLVVLEGDTITHLRENNLFDPHKTYKVHPEEGPGSEVTRFGDLLPGYLSAHAGKVFSIVEQIYSKRPSSF